jgi:hypothetical protein
MGWKFRGSNPGLGKNFRNRPPRPFHPPSLLYNELYVIPGGKWPNRGTDHPSPSGAEVKDKVYCTSVPLLVFVACSR